MMDNGATKLSYLTLYKLIKFMKVCENGDKPMQHQVSFSAVFH